MKANDFFFDSVQLLYYTYHKINFKRLGSYIESPEAGIILQEKKYLHYYAEQPQIIMVILIAWIFFPLEWKIRMKKYVKIKIFVELYYHLKKIMLKFSDSHEKRKDSMERSLDWVLFSAELEFPKILVPRLPQNTSDGNIECAGKSKQLYSCFFTCDQLLGALIYLNFIILILICFHLMMLGVTM